MIGVQRGSGVWRWIRGSGVWQWERSLNLLGRVLFSLALLGWVLLGQLPAGAGMSSVKREGGTRSRTGRGHSASGRCGDGARRQGLSLRRCPETLVILEDRSGVETRELKDSRRDICSLQVEVETQLTVEASERITTKRRPT